MIQLCKYLCAVLLICTIGIKAQAQLVLAANTSTGHPDKATVSGSSKPELLKTPAKPALSVDTLPCLLHVVVVNYRPVMSWKKGYIVVENQQLKINNNNYPVGDAVQLTGFIQNIFLKNNKKTVITDKVIQVVML